MAIFTGLQAFLFTPPRADIERIDWRSVADHLPGRNNKECRKRWYQKFAANTNSGSWTEEEDGRLRTAIALHGAKWASVAKDVGTRSSEQCSKRWNDVLNPDLDRSPWTPEDVCASRVFFPVCCQLTFFGRQSGSSLDDKREYLREKLEDDIAAPFSESSCTRLEEPICPATSPTSSGWPISRHSFPIHG